jgi:hypothetical protein
MGKKLKEVKNKFIKTIIFSSNTATRLTAREQMAL